MKKSLIVAALGLTTAFAHAHDDATLDKIKTPNGGQLRMAGSYHFELVLDKTSKEAKDNPVLLYLTDHADNKLPSAGIKVIVILLGSGQKATAELKPDGDNRLKGSARYAATPDLKAVVTLTTADGKTEQARFTPFVGVVEPVAPAAGGHQHH
jgi:hypothetical protein